MTSSPGNGGRPERRLLAEAVAARRRAQLVNGLRGVARTVSLERATVDDGEVCDLCGIGIPDDHRHLLHLVERRIVCACEACWAMRSGDGDYRPTGRRTLWLPELNVPDELWAGFRIPIGLAFFMESTVTCCVVAMYPSPAGATESELHFESWSRMCELNPVLRKLEPDIEGLLVNRLSQRPAYAIAPIDKCYELTGLIKTKWEGISGGPGIAQAVSDFFEQLRTRADEVRVTTGRASR
jgi:Family of unknown function (DUF5947)